MFWAFFCAKLRFFLHICKNYCIFAHFLGTSMRWSKEAKDTIWLIGLQGINYLAPLLVWPYLMMVLGAEQFGVFSFGIAFAQYLMILVDFGFNLTATKQIALAKGNAAETNRLFSATLVAKIILLLLSGIIALVVSLLPMYAAYRTIVWITWLMVVGNTFSLLWLFQGAGKIRLATIINSVLKLLILPFTFVCVKTSADIYIAAWIQVAVFISTAITMIVLTRVLKLAKLTTIRWIDIKEQFLNSWSIFLSNAATSTYTALFVVILAYFVSADEVGRYAAVEKIMRCACYLIWIPISQAYFPRVSRLSAENREEGKRLVRILTIVVIIVLGAAGLFLAFGVEPLTAWLGKDYIGIGNIAVVMAAVPMMIGLGGVQGQMRLIAMGEEKEKIAFRNIYIIAGALSLICVLPLSYFWGAIGAAAALVITEGFVCIAMCTCRRRKQK